MNLEKEKIYEILLNYNIYMNLKYSIVLLFVLFYSVNTIQSQGVSIGEALSEPHNSAILDLQSIERGFLLPRMTTAERNNINLPALSLMIFNMTTNCLEIYVETWHKVWCQEPDTGFFCGTSTVSFIYNGQDVTYGTVVGANDRCWLDRNLGASQVATSSTDELAYGDLFQWGRGIDGHQIRTSGVTSGDCDAVNTDSPPHSNFIKCNQSNPWDWRFPQNHNLWQGLNGINNPCPEGWRIPTADEWNNERLSWTSNNSFGAFASPLKLSIAGNRGISHGLIMNGGSTGYYWTSSVDDIRSKSFHFVAASADIHSSYRAHGLTIRCIQD